MSSHRRALRPVMALVGLLLASPLPAGAAVHLPSHSAECIEWAVQDLDAALQEAKVTSQADIHVQVRSAADLPPESFALMISGETAQITGGDAVGAMYGVMELAEQIRNCGVHGEWRAVVNRLSSTTQRPFLSFRADNVFIHCSSRSLQLDVPMWEAYIAQLARSRFNVLDLHGGYDLQTTGFPNLYPLLVHVPEYPDVGDPAQQQRNLADFKTIVDYAHSRGVQVALMNYSVGGTPLKGEPLADYTARAVAALLKAVPELHRLGFRVGETGQPADFFHRAYLRGVTLSGRNDVQVYTRSWLTTQEQLEAIGREQGGNFGIEIKFNGEQLGLPYQAIGKGGGSYSYQGYVKADAPYRIIWQIRADGTHRFWAWAGTEFVRRTVRACQLGRARGFSLEPYTAYFPTEPAAYYRSPADQRVYRYIWQKYWMWHLLWGRLGYNPELPEATLVAAFRYHYGAPGEAIYRAMQAASPIVPLVCAYRYQGPDQRDWSPETETGCFANQGRDWNRLDPKRQAERIGIGAPTGFDALSFSRHPPMDPSAFAGIRDFVKMKLTGHPDGRVGPPWIARLLSEAASATRAAISRVGATEGQSGDEWRLLKTDLLCTAALGAYYAARILGVTHLVYATSTGSAPDYQQAVRYLAQSRERWKALANIADPIFAPLDNPLRHQRQFQWSQPLPMLEKLDATAPTLWAAVPPRSGSKSLQFTPADEGADLRITVTDLHHLVRHGQAEIRCNAAAPAGVKAVTLWYRDLPSESIWQQAPMSSGAGSEFSARVPVSAAGLLYFVQVEDANGQARNFPEVLKATPYRVIEPWEVR